MPPKLKIKVSAKRKSDDGAATTSNKKPKKTAAAAKKDEDDVSSDLPLNQWRIVMTGEFIGIASLKETLKSHGVSIAGSVSGKTTHLLLGKSGRNEYGRASGAGSKKHQEAVARNLPIITQNQLMRLLAGQSMDEATAVPKKPAKSATTYDKVIYCVASSNDEQKISLLKLKQALKEEYGIDASKGASKSALKKALDKATEEGTLEKDGGSYKIPLKPVAMKAAPPETLEAKLKRMAPPKGHWRGLRAVSTKKSKSGRATCRGCQTIIAKGSMQVEVVDDSLLKMLTRKGGLFEGEDNGEVECMYPGFATAASKKFFVHESCQDDADALFRSKFEEDWARIQPHVANNVRDWHGNGNI